MHWADRFLVLQDRLGAYNDLDALTADVFAKLGQAIKLLRFPLVVNGEVKDPKDVSLTKLTEHVEAAVKAPLWQLSKGFKLWHPPKLGNAATSVVCKAHAELMTIWAAYIEVLF
jgi:hypothetical protein